MQIARQVISQVKRMFYGRLRRAKKGKMDKLINGFSEQKTIKCYCNNCSKEINHTIIKSIKRDWNEDYKGYPIDGSDDYQIIQCVGCNTYSFRIDGYFSEYVECYPDGNGTNGSYERLYPESTRYYRELKTFDNLPYNLIQVYEEAVSSFNQNRYILCSVGIRSILDGICIDQKIKKGQVEIKKRDGSTNLKYSTNLDGKINGLRENEIITKNQMMALHELRFLGNKAIHELETPSKKDLLIAFDIIEHILIDIYDLKEKSKELRKKREKS